jgi:GNAT superfamily N-acetyltransferase
LVCLSLNRPFPNMKPVISVTIRKAVWNDLKRFQVCEYPDFVDDFSEWLRKDYHFYVALDGETIVSYGCAKPASQSMFAKFNFERLEKPVTAEGYRAFTLPEYRGKRVYPVLAIAVLRSLKETGYERIVGTVNAYDYSARRAHQRTGYKEVTLKTDYFPILANLRTIMGVGES